LLGGRLFQQYVVDAWASTEQSLLNWIRYNQKTLRADIYSSLHDAAANADHRNPDMAQHGERVILPSTHIGST
jgi:hypothetical protein